MQQLVDNESHEYLAEQYRIIHSEGRYKGKVLPYIRDKVQELILYSDAKTLLDYGSGKGEQYDVHRMHEAWQDIVPLCYDPGWPPFATKPTGKFDGVICTDVAEHIPEKHVDAFLADVIGYASKFVFFVIFTDPAKALLPDGRNAHLTIRPPAWWNERILTALTAGGGKTTVSLGRHGAAHTAEFWRRLLETFVIYRTRDNKHLE